MDLQTLFYVVSIVFMVTMILVVVGLAIGAWKVKQTFNHMPSALKTAFTGFLFTQRKEVLLTAGLTAAGAMLAKLTGRGKKK